MKVAAGEAPGGKLVAVWIMNRTTGRLLPWVPTKCLWLFDIDGERSVLFFPCIGVQRCVIIGSVAE